MKLRLLASLTCSFGFIVSNSVFAAPVSASMNIIASAATTNNNSQQYNGSSSWGPASALLLSPLSINTTVSVTDAAGNRITTIANGNATWGTGGNSGSVVFNYGWSGQNGATGFSSFTNHSNGNDWTYTFISDVNGLFNMSYNVSATGQTAGLNGWNIGWSGAGGGLLLTNLVDPTANGVFSRSIVAGTSYTVDLINNASASGVLTNAQLNGLFNFNMAPQVSAVPVPGAIWLFGGGLGFLTFARRRKNSNG